MSHLHSIKQKRICRWLGPAHQIGQALCYYVLIDGAEFIARSTVIPIPDKDLHSDTTKSLMQQFTTSVEDKIGHFKHAKDFNSSNPTDVYYSTFGDAPDIDDNAEFVNFSDDTELQDIPVADQKDQYFADLDEYIGRSVVIPGRDGSTNVLAIVKGRKRDSAGNPIGTPNDNPILDGRIYQLEFPDGRVEEYALNVIIEALYAQVDDEGFDVGILDEIVGLRTDASIAIPIIDGFDTFNGVQRPKRTTKGWDIQIKWKDGSYNWLPLSSVKESYPIQLSEYANAHKLQHEPAFKWWATKVLRHRDSIIKAVTARCLKGNMQFGVVVPISFDDAKWTLKMAILFGKMPLKNNFKTRA